MGPGEVFGKYQLLAQIASGGMAEIWLARSSSIGGFEKLLAIKRMRSDLSHNARFISMFIDEAKLTVSLNHPNIVQVFDFGRVDDDYFMAMEFVEGIDLAQLARRARKTGRRVPVAMSLFIMHSVFEGLAYAHTRRTRAGESAGIIHRDISPQNVLVSFDGHVKVSDFGIAKVAAGFEPLDGGQAFGKLAYVSPEQLHGIAVEPATDLWSAGVILHELLTNERLFARRTDDETREAVECAEISVPSDKNPEVPSEVDDVVLEVLQREPSSRPESAREVAEILGRVLGRSFPEASAFQLTEYVTMLWDNELPRIVVDETSGLSGVGVQEAKSTSEPSGADRESHAPSDRSPGPRPASRTETEVSIERTVPSSQATSPRLPTHPTDLAVTTGHKAEAHGDERSRSDLDELRRQFRKDPNLWTIVELGRVYRELGMKTKSLGVLKMAAAKFAQRGLLIQAACIYREMMDTVEPASVREEIRRLRVLAGMPDDELIEVIITNGGEDTDFSECRELMAPTAQRFKVFGESPILSRMGADQLATFIESMKLRRFDTGATIIQEGARGDSFFIIGRGRVIVSSTDFAGRRTYLTSLSDTDCFGEQSFFTGEPRSATVEALEPVTLIEVTKDVLDRLMELYPSVKETLRHFYKQRVAQALLTKSEIFGNLSARARQAFAERFTFKSYEGGDVILREGEVSDAIYAIKSGRFEVSTGSGDDRVVLAHLGPGEIFGEMAALEGTKRTATVRATEASELLCMAGAELNALLAENVEVRHLIEEKSADRARARVAAVERHRTGSREA